MRIDLFSDSLLTNDLPRLRSQVATRWGKVKQVKEFTQLVAGHESTPANPRLLQEFAELESLGFVAEDRYVSDKYGVYDNFFETECYGFFSSKKQDYGSYYLNLSGLAVDMFLHVINEYETLILKNKPLAKNLRVAQPTTKEFLKSNLYLRRYLRAIEKTDIASLDNYDHNPFLGISNLIDYWMLGKIHDVCLEYGGYGPEYAKIATERVVYSIFDKVNLAGLYVAEHLQHVYGSDKVYLRAFRASEFIIRSKVALPPVELYLDDKYLLSVRLGELYYDVNRYCTSAG